MQNRGRLSGSDGDRSGPAAKHMFDDTFNRQSLSIYLRPFYVLTPKRDRGNISRPELDALRALADELLNYDEVAVEAAVEAGALIEVNRDDKADQED